MQSALDIARSIAHDLYFAARPHFSDFMAIAFTFVILYLATKLFGRDLSEFFRGIIHEMNSVAERKNNPQSANFMIAVLIFIIFLIAELAHTLYGIFAKSHGPDWVMYLSFAAVLGLFFILSHVATSFSSRNKSE